MAWQSLHVTPPLGLAEISEFIQRFDGNVGGRLKDDQFIIDCWGLFRRPSADQGPA